MKNKVFDFLGVILALILAGILLYFIYENGKLDNIISNQNNFIKEVTGKESEFIKESKKYRDSLVSYSNKTVYLTDGKSLTSAQFVKAFDKMRQERDSIQALFNYAQDMYGFDVTLKWTSDTTQFLSRKGISKADSAVVALEHFHDRIKLKNNKWLIYLDGVPEVPKKQPRSEKSSLKAIITDTTKNQPLKPQ